MEAIKSWAKSVFMLSMFASTVMLLVPKSMQKQAKFAAEMLLLLCVVAPVVGLLSGARSVPASPGFTWSESVPPFALGDYLVSETERRVTEMASIAGIPLDRVSVVPSREGYGIEEVRVVLKSPVSDQEGEAFKGTLAAYLSIPADKVFLVVKEAQEDSR
ncbi:MAG TPA: hypothetical protein GXX23_10920 [Firmicutes bacterium]|nr:hypothetical protein [Candidatus Fermentithermobacillaceae bacterium]